MSGDLIRHVSVNQFLSFYFDGNPLKTEFLPKKTVGPTFSQITHKMRELQRPNVESFFDLKKQIRKLFKINLAKKQHEWMRLKRIAKKVEFGDFKRKKQLSI